jgi:hypothetical protein
VNPPGGIHVRHIRRDVMCGGSKLMRRLNL